MRLAVVKRKDTYTAGTGERERDGQRVEKLIAGRNGVS